MSDIFVTVFRNRSNHPVEIDDYNGVIARLEPGQEWELKSTTARTLYSRFAEVVYKKGDAIETRGNPEWKNPYEGFWCLVLNNEDGAHSESFQILTPQEAGEVIGLSPNNFIEAKRGFPRIVPVDIHCKLIRYSKIEWREETERVPVDGAPGYWETRTMLKKILIPRSDGELRKIETELEKEALDKAKAEAEKS